MAADTETDVNPSDISVNLDNYRKLVKSYMDLHLYSAALFWADKIVVLSNSEPRDVYWLAHCMYLLKQYHRAAHIIQSKGLDKTHMPCHYITVKCLYEAGKLTEALQLLECVEPEQQSVINYDKLDATSNSSLMFDDQPKNKMLSAIMFLKGRVLEAMENRELASECYTQALQYDVFCYEAFESLIQHQMLTAHEEQELLNSLPISQQCSQSEAQILKLLYKSKLKKYHANYSESDHNVSSVKPITPLEKLQATLNLETKMDTSSTITDIKETSEPKPSNIKISSVPCMTAISRLGTSLDMDVSTAEKYFYNCEYRQCIRITENVLKKDPYHGGCLLVHIACLVELKDPTKLFYLAHKLVDLYPDLAISWFAVGCYYFIIGKSDPARRYLSKATTLDRLFGPAWLAYGHSFAIENEHDQAMAAYFKASQLMKGCHLPLLYIGLECGLTNNERLAEKFFQQAKAIAPDDPFVMHEMGVIAFQNLDYTAAEKHFQDALDRIGPISSERISEKWEPLFNNLGHTYRKLKNYETALYYHEEALLLSPQNPSTYSALGFVQALMGQTQAAVDSFHKALGLRKNDTFSITMLRYVIEELMDETIPFKDAPESIPEFSFPSKPQTYENNSPSTTISSEIGECQDVIILQDNTNVTNVVDMSMSFD